MVSTAETVMPAPSLTPEARADLLGETEPAPRQALRYYWHRFGPAGMQALLATVQTIEAQGGKVLPSGRRRTPGGILFWLLKTGWVPPRVDLRPPVSVVPLVEVWPTWPTDLRKGSGKVKVVLTGRPKETLEQEDYVLLQLESQAPQQYPRGLPVPPAEGLLWTVLIARPQWLRVAPALRRDREDILIIEGQPCQVDTALFLYATNVTTKAQQRAKAAQQRHAALVQA